MKALLLAAGLGTRLRPLTEKTPKPLLPIGGKPLMEYHLDHLRLHGVNEVLINTHYLAEQIVDFTKHYQIINPGLLITLTHEEVLLGSAGTLLANMDFFVGAEDFLVVYGDNLTDINYTKLFNRHKTSNSIATIACYREKHPEQKGIIETDDNGRILRFIEKPKSGETKSNLANAGLYIFNQDILNHIQKLDGSPLDFGFDVFPYLIKNNISMSIYPMTEGLLDIGSLKNYYEAPTLLKSLTLS